MIVSGNGTEFTAIAILGFADRERVDGTIAPGNPGQNAFIELQRRLRTRCSARHSSPRPQARAEWRVAADYDINRPRYRVGWPTPAECADTFNLRRDLAQCSSLSALVARAAKSAKTNASLGPVRWSFGVTSNAQRIF
jgi:hypothetical protein